MTFTTSQKGEKYIRDIFPANSPVCRSFDLCKQAHNGLRKDGVTEEWFHQVSIVLYLLTLGADEETIIVGFLHDIHEDTGYSLLEIKKEFGAAVAESVKLLSKKSPGHEKMDNDLYYAGMASNRMASIVKGADRINNVQTMDGVFSPTKQLAYLAEVDSHVLPMLKCARKEFPIHRMNYENIKHVLMTQSSLIRIFLNHISGAS